jgi:hypothetical protein
MAASLGTSGSNCASLRLWWSNASAMACSADFWTVGSVSVVRSATSGDGEVGVGLTECGAAQEVAACSTARSRGAGEVGDACTLAAVSSSSLSGPAPG